MKILALIRLSAAFMIVMACIGAPSAMPPIDAADIERMHSEALRMAALDVLKEDASTSAKNADARFDGDFMLMSGELTPCLPTASKRCATKFMSSR